MQATARLLDKVRAFEPLCRACNNRLAPGAHRRAVPRPFSQSPLLPILPMQGFSEQQISCQRFLNLRYDGTDVPIMTLAPADGDYAAAFEQAYQVGGAARHPPGAQQL